MLGIFFWSAVHIALHLHSYTTENVGNNSTSDSINDVERLRNNIEDDQNPVVTGGLAILFLLIMLITSIKRLRILFKFVLFYTIHLILSGLVYLLVFFHGTQHVNSYFWKWLIPIVFLWVFELLHRKFSCKLHKVKILEARTTGDFTIYKVVKPSLFKFTPGQFLSVSLPAISKLSWNHCYIFSAPSDKVLKCIIQYKYFCIHTPFLIVFKLCGTKERLLGKPGLQDCVCTSTKFLCSFRKQQHCIKLQRTVSQWYTISLLLYTFFCLTVMVKKITHCLIISAHF